MQLQMQMQKLMKVAKLTNQILMLKPIRQIGGPEVAMPCVLAGAVAFCKLGGPASQIKQNKAYNKSGRGRTVDHLFPDGNESEQRPEEKGHGNNGQTQLLCGPGFQMKMRVVGR